MQNTRQILRQSILKLRRQVTLDEQQTAAKKIAARLEQHPLFQTSQHIAGYVAVNGEVDPTPLLQPAWQQNKICYLPVLTDNQTLQFVRYNAGDNLKLNRFNILEPEITAEKIIAPEKLDLVLTPLVAFDNHGNRLGMGKGYYDRTFEFLQSCQRPTKPFLLGLAYELQKIEKLIAAKWDIKLDAVITEKFFFDFT